MFQLLELYIKQRVEASNEEVEKICSYFKMVTANKNEILLSPNQICDKYYFVNTGCIRLYNINSEGEEGTRYFAFEGAFGTSLPSFIENSKSFEFIQAIEKSELLFISRTDFYALVDSMPCFAFIYRRILELSFITAQKRIYGFQGFTALEKVKWLLEYQPLILSRISNKLAASYLGVDQSTLSRTKKELYYGSLS